MFKSVFVCMFALITLVLFTGCPATPPGDDGGNNPPPGDSDNSVTQAVDGNGGQVNVQGVVVNIQPNIVQGANTMTVTLNATDAVPVDDLLREGEMVVSDPITIKWSTDQASENDMDACTIDVPITAKNLPSDIEAFGKVQLMYLDADGVGWPILCEVKNGYAHAYLSTAPPTGQYVLVYISSAEYININAQVNRQDRQSNAWLPFRLISTYDSIVRLAITYRAEFNALDFRNGGNPAKYWSDHYYFVYFPTEWVRNLKSDVESDTARVATLFQNQNFRQPHLRQYGEGADKHFVVYIMFPWTRDPDDLYYRNRPMSECSDAPIENRGSIYIDQMILLNPDDWYRQQYQSASSNNIDERQPKQFSGIFGHELTHAVIRSYEIPTNFSQGKCLPGTIHGLHEGMASYVQQLMDEDKASQSGAAGPFYARSVPGEAHTNRIHLLSKPLLTYEEYNTYGNQDFFVFVENRLRADKKPQWLLFSLLPSFLGNSEQEFNKWYSYYAGNYPDSFIIASLLSKLDESLSPHFTADSSRAYWAFAKDRTYENTLPLRPSDELRGRSKINVDLFDSSSFVVCTLNKTQWPNFDSARDLPAMQSGMLDKMPPCTSRIIQLDLSSFPKKGKLKLHFTRYAIGEAGYLGDWLRAKAYHGADSAELGEQEEELTVNNLGEGNDTVYVLISNVSRLLFHSVRITAEWQTLEGGTYRFVGTLDLVVDPTGKLAEAGVQAGKEIEYRVTLNFDQQGRQTRDGTVETLEDLYDHFPLPTGGEYVILKDRFLATDFQGLRMQNVLTPGPVQAGKISKYELGEFWGEYSAPPGVVPNLSGDYTLTGGSDNDLLLMINTEYNRGELPQVESTPKWTVLETLTDEQGRQSAIYAKMRIAEFY